MLLDGGRPSSLRLIGFHSDEAATIGWRGHRSEAIAIRLYNALKEQHRCFSLIDDIQRSF